MNDDPSPSAFPRSDAFVREILAEFPKFRIVDKRTSLLSRTIDLALKLVTAGGQKQYLTHYHTILGNTLFVPARWHTTPDLHRLVTLRHERVHMRQRRRLGDALMVFLYALPFFPLGLAYGRACIEWEAYRETIRATLELLGPDEAQHPDFRAHIVKQFTSAAYGWMWPFPGVVRGWFERALAEAMADHHAIKRPTQPAGPA